eukprot:6202853-Pleurochrysis_carterae.AAC.1
MKPRTIVVASPCSQMCATELGLGRSGYRNTQHCCMAFNQHPQKGLIDSKCGFCMPSWFDEIRHLCLAAALAQAVQCRTGSCQATCLWSWRSTRRRAAAPLPGKSRRASACASPG